MQFIGDFTVSGALCDRLIELHRACDRQGLVKRGAMSKGDKPVVDIAKKDSFDVFVASIPEAMQDEYGVGDYFAALKGCLDLYTAQHPVLQKIGTYRMTETPIIQHYRPGGGFPLEHFERSSLATTTRMLVMPAVRASVSRSRIMGMDTTLTEKTMAANTPPTMV